MLLLKNWKINVHIIQIPTIRSGNLLMLLEQAAEALRLQPYLNLLTLQNFHIGFVSVHLQEYCIYNKGKDKSGGSKII